MTEKTRNEIEEKYKWDLSLVYKNDDEFIKDYESIIPRIEKFKENENTFLKNADNLYNTLKELYDIEMLLSKMSVYTFLKYDTDITNTKNQAWNEKITHLYDDFGESASFLTPKLLEFGQEKISEFYKENEKLKEFEFALEDTFREKEHILSLESESLISSLSKAFSNTEDISSMLLNSEIDFGTIKDEEGNTVKLTDVNYSAYIKSKDRNVRKEAFETLYKGYKRFNNTLALAFSADINKRMTFAKVRKYGSSLDAALFSDNIDRKVYENLIKTMSENLEPLYDYFKLKKEVRFYVLI